MIRSILFSAVSVAFLIFSGCSKTNDGVILDVDYEEESLLVTLPVGWGSENAFKNDQISSYDITNKGKKIFSVICDFGSEHLEIKKTSHDEKMPRITVRFSDG